MQKQLGFLALTILLGMATSAAAQFKEGPAEGPQVAGKSEVTRWRFGVIVKASGGPCRNINGYVPVPAEWPEQQVQIVNEETSPGVRISYQVVDGGAKIMNIQLGQLLANEEAKALVTFEVRRSELLPPGKTDTYVFADPKKVPRDVKRYLVQSPGIEMRDPKIRVLAKEVGADKEKAWDHVEAIYDWCHAHVQYRSGPDQGAVRTLREGKGDCEGFTSLFIAICRAADIPARTVWVSGHVYPEFYLEDDKGEGHWFPCQSISSKGSQREFGGITMLAPIIEKGDNFRPPKAKAGQKRQRFLSEFLIGTPATKDARPPQCSFIRQPAPK